MVVVVKVIQILYFLGRFCYGYQQHYEWKEKMEKKKKKKKEEEKRRDNRDDFSITIKNCRLGD